jgi:glycolate oxidase
MDAKIIDEIIKIVGKGNALTAMEDRKCYSYDARTDGAAPDMVAFPSSAEEVSQILKLANRYLFPVIPRGQGTGLTGGSIPLNGGVVLVFTRMNKIIEIDTRNLIAVA